MKSTLGKEPVMRKSHASIALVAFLIMLGYVVAPADVPLMISFQGSLADENGDPVNGTVDLTLRIYDDPNSGSQLWSESQQNVEVADGLFNVILGTNTPIGDDVFMNPDRWLGVEVDGGPELEPRTRLTSVPYAHRVSTVDRATGGAILGDVEIFNGLTVDANITAFGTATFGFGHTIAGANSFVSGQNHTVLGLNATISGGDQNTAGANNSSIGGGVANSASGISSTIAGGFNNSTEGNFSTIGGGAANFIGEANSTTIGGGTGNIVSGFGATVAGGTVNSAYDTSAFVGGGSNNRARGKYAVIGGGGGFTVADTNSASGEFSTISGGRGSTASGNYTTVGGGFNNAVTADYGTVCGGFNNTVSGLHSVIGGGRFHECLGGNSSIIGGESDTLTADVGSSMAFGSYVYLDNSYRAAFFEGTYYGRVTINRDDQDGTATYPLQVGTASNNGNGAYLTAGGVWTNGSSRLFKENGRPLEGSSLLERISALPVYTWQYINSDEQHVGPYAEDFVAAFDVGAVREADGSRENQYLAAGDVAGVALAGIKELIRENNELKEMIHQLQKEIESLKDNK